MLFNFIFHETFFQEYLQGVKQYGFNAGPTLRFVVPALGPNRLQRLSADGTCRQKGTAHVENLTSKIFSLPYILVKSSNWPHVFLPIF